MTNAANAVDIASRTKYFRNSLIEEFRLSESDTSTGFEAPQYSSQVFRNGNQVKDILRHKPHSLIKFKIFKRNLGDENEEKEDGSKTPKKPGRLQKSSKKVTLQSWATWLSNHRYFSSFVICTIVVNAMILGIQTFLDEIEDWRMVQMLDILDHVTMVVFVLEILLKWISNFREFWRDGWNNFDFLVTAGSLAPLIGQALAGASSNAESFSKVAKNMKIFRTFRTLKMIAKFRSLRIIVRTIVEALQSLGFVLVLLMLLMYIFAILAIGLFSDYSNSTKPELIYQDKFVDMLTSVKTLFQLLTLDQWYNIAAEIATIETINNLVTITYFIVWVALGAFIFRNIFIGVMVKNFQSISQELSDLDHAHRKKVRMQKYAKELHQHMDEKRKSIANVGQMSNGTQQVNDFSILPGLEMKDDDDDGDQNAGGGRRKSEIHHNKFPMQTFQSFPMNDEVSELQKEMKWMELIDHSVKYFKENEPGTTLWPRDTLLDYFTTMEKLQENIKEHQELQSLAAVALYNIVTDE